MNKHYLRKKYFNVKVNGENILNINIESNIRFIKLD